jgi:hypothetical protein
MWEQPAMTEKYVDKTGTMEKLDPMNDVFLEFPRAMKEVARVTRFGAQKHSPRGWRTFKHLYAFKYHLSKVGRHLLGLEVEGSLNLEDVEEGCPPRIRHMAQVAWNALAYLEHEMMRNDEPFDPDEDGPLYKSSVAHSSTDDPTMTKVEHTPEGTFSGYVVEGSGVKQYLPDENCDPADGPPDPAKVFGL